MGTHDDVLGVPPTATPDEIEDRYRDLAKVVHPDAGGDAITFQVLSESYEVLADPAQRAAYDRSLGGDPVIDAFGAQTVDSVGGSALFRNSTPQQRARALRDVQYGRESWHLTPREWWRVKARRLLEALLAVALLILMLLLTR